MASYNLKHTEHIVFETVTNGRVTQKPVDQGTYLPQKQHICSDTKTKKGEQQ